MRKMCHCHRAMKDEDDTVEGGTASTLVELLLKTSVHVLLLN
jgi:hypothetical protein